MVCGSRSTRSSARRRRSTSTPSSSPGGWDSLQAIRSHTGPWRRDERATSRSARDSQFAEVAVPFGGARAARGCSHRRHARDRLLRPQASAAGLIALLAAALAGFFLSRVFARRVHRRARREPIAGGRFDEPVVDTSADELGSWPVPSTACASSWRRWSGPARVHRQRLARAADADLRPRWPCRAADRRGHGRADQA